MSTPTNADLAQSIAALKTGQDRLQEMMLAGFSDLRAEMEFGFAKHDARFDHLEAKIDSRFNHLESRIEDLETKRRKRP